MACPRLVLAALCALCLSGAARGAGLGGAQPTLVAATGAAADDGGSLLGALGVRPAPASG